MLKRIPFHDVNSISGQRERLFYCDLPWASTNPACVAHHQSWKEGLPYIPRVHLSEGSLVRSPLRWLCSEEPMVRRSFIPKFLYSESCYVPKIPYSERPPTIWILCYEGSLVRSSSSPKVLCSELPYSENRPSPIRVLYYEGPFVRSPSSSKIAMFRRFYLPNVYGWPSLP